MLSEIRDHREFDELFRREYPDLAKWCRRRIQIRGMEPEDLLHDAYLRCRSRWQSGRQSIHHPGAYLRRALRWQLLDSLRAITRRVRHERAAAEQWTGCRAADDPRAAPLIRESIEQLTGRARQVCQLALTGESPRGIEVALRLSRGAVQVHLSRARRSLREYFEPGP